MREPPNGFGSATRCRVIFCSLGPTSRMKRREGAWTAFSYRGLFVANQSRLLFFERSPRKRKKSGVKYSPIVVPPTQTRPGDGGAGSKGFGRSAGRRHDAHGPHPGGFFCPCSTFRPAPTTRTA